MGINNLSIGSHPPDEVNAIIEVPKGGATIKYKMDKTSALLIVDRRLHTPMFYPAHFWFKDAMADFYQRYIKQPLYPCNNSSFSQISG